ncbi:Imm49 family immunity protein [Marinomonas spartinae]|uniref:Imm49 family immunity protein n=1 Tax=Marinomonas spartinae TaxID=1792290 RepID=UPI0018F18EE4|nr:Imm49 family immunity protein [Marinomonas spartinae]MBJ7553946.1 immunity 49 family protein [Marinomonas spartinae]
MKPTLINDKMIARLQHCDNKVNSDFNTPEELADMCEKIESQADPEHSVTLISLLSSYLRAKAMSHWFHGGDLATFKNLCYNLLKLKYISGQPPCNNARPRTATEDSIFYLLSDHEPLISWFSQLMYDYEVEVNHKESSKVNGGAYYSLQLALALRGDLDLLGERAEYFVENPPKNWAKRFLLDNQFYVALAKGDKQGMEAVIRELVTPRKIYQRQSAEGAYTENLISSLGLRYSKLAWRYGYEIIVDSPYLPKEWIPVQPLENYEDEFDFMKAFPI